MQIVQEEGADNALFRFVSIRLQEESSPNSRGLRPGYGVKVVAFRLVELE